MRGARAGPRRGTPPAAAGIPEPRRRPAFNPWLQNHVVNHAIKKQRSFD
jgi:hypothetical protein